MPQTLFIKPFLSPSSTFFSSKSKLFGDFTDANINQYRRVHIVCLGMLAPRKFLQRRKKVEVFEDGADKADQKNWRKLMTEIDESDSAVSVLQSRKAGNQSLPKDLVVGTLVRFKQLRKWNIVSEILEWLRTQHWWDFSEMDFLMLLIAYGKQGEFSKTERVLSYMTKKGHLPSVISHTALMEAYGRGKQYKKAEAVFRRMQTSGPEPSAITYQIIFKTFVEGDKFKEAEEIFETLLNEKRSPLKPDQKMYHMMIYMYKKAGNYEKARKVFGMMAERGVQRSTVTYNSLMSFETNYKEVANIYDEMQKAGLAPDVVSYALLVSVYGKARREEEALAVFEEMLDAGVRPTPKAYNILLDAFAISGMVEQARTVFKSMRRDRITPDLCSYTTMLSAYVNATDMEGAERFFRRIKQDGLEPSVVTYGTLIKGYAKIIDLEKMMEKYEEMRVCGIKANETIYTTIMDAYGKNKDFDSAVLWYKEMVSSRVRPDKKAKNILLSLAKTGEEQAEAKQLIGDDVDGFVMSVEGYENEKNDENDDFSSENGDSDEDQDGDNDDDNDGANDDDVIDLNDVNRREDLFSLSSVGAL